MYYIVRDFDNIATREGSNSHGSNTSTEEEAKLNQLKTTMKNVFSSPELTRKMVATHPETIITIFK